MSRLYVPIVLLLLVVSGCVEQSDTIVTFDEVLESTSFHNQLLAPVVLIRDGVVLDTLPASSTRSYLIGHRGPVRHAWHLIAPRDRYGAKAGVEPLIDLGVQYALRGNYTLDNDLTGRGPDAGRTIFTPLVANFSGYNLRLIANYQEADQVITDYLIPRSIDSILSHAPYFYWNSQSNIRLESTPAGFYRMFSRADTAQYELRIDPDYSGTGRTVPLTVY